jgi:hypothetical protein
LLAGGFLKGTDEIVVWNTVTGLKYLDNWQTQFPDQHAAAERQGGLILPR